jgi:hypothetical protein
VESLRKRLELLEDRVAQAQKDSRGTFLGALTDDELRWLCEPIDEAQARVSCPHVEMVGCGCKSDGRTQRGVEAFPELEEEYQRRKEALGGTRGPSQAP